MNILQAFVKDCNMFLNEKPWWFHVAALIFGIALMYACEKTIFKKSTKAELVICTLTGFFASSIMFIQNHFMIGTAMFILTAIVFIAELASIPLINKAKLEITINQMTKEVSVKLKNMNEEESHKPQKEKSYIDIKKTE